MQKLFLCFLFGFTVQALAADVPAMTISEIAPGVYLHQSYHNTDDFGVVSANGLVVVDNGKAFIVDTPWSENDTEALVNWIKQHNYQLTGSVSTHSHEDRTAGITWLNSHAIPTYATALTNQFLDAGNKTLATHAITENDTKLAGGLLEVFYPGAGHTLDNVVVWLPKANMLFGGCFIRSLEAKNLGYTGEADIAQWPASVDALLGKYPNAKLVVPGHGATGDMALVKHTKALALAASK
jgi:glyoxylase-like metal-dependent hydrolase (beta-lactamase superfamily II)